MEKAFVLINCELGKEEYILNSLRNIKSVKETHGTFGAFDIITEVINDDPDELREDITWKIRSLPSIIDTLTLTGTKNKEDNTS